MAQEGDDRVHAVDEHEWLVVDRDDALGIEVGSGVLWEFPVPFVHVLAEGFGLVHALWGGVVGMGQDSVGVLLAEFGHFFRLDAVDVHAERDGEGGLVLEDADLVDDGGVELGGGCGGIHRFGVEVGEEFELKAVDGLP